MRARRCDNSWAAPQLYCRLPDISGKVPVVPRETGNQNAAPDCNRHRACPGSIVWPDRRNPVGDCPARLAFWHRTRWLAVRLIVAAESELFELFELFDSSAAGIGSDRGR